jgi:PAS domain S-box-containing protein
LILKRIRKSLTLKWMVLLTPLAVISLTIACLGIFQIYHGDLKRSFIAVEGIVLILGILFIFFLTKEVILPIKRMPKGVKEELVKRTRELEVLNEIGALINQNLGNLDKVLPITLEKVANLTGYEMGALLLLNEVGDILEMKSQIGHSPAMLKEVRVLKFNEGVSGEAVRLKQPVIVSISEYPSARIAPILREEGVQAVVGIPLMTKGKAIGAIILSSRSPHKLSQKEINSLENIGNQIGIVLENTKLFSTVAKAKSEWETTFDAVTDLITIRDKDYRIIRANVSAFKRFGLRPEEVVEKRCFETFYQSDKPCEGCYVTEAFKTKKPTSGERDSKYLNGIFQYFAFPVYDEAGEVVAVVDLAREITEEKRLEVEREVVGNVNKILAYSLDMEQGVQSVYAELKKVLDCERMAVALFDEEGEGFRYFAMEKDYDAGELAGNVLYPWKGTHFETVTETGLPVIVMDTTETDSWIGQRLLKEGIHSSLIFPLEYKKKIIGTVNFGSSKPNHFSEVQFNLLRQIAPGLAIFIQNILLFRETKKRLEELTILHEITKISTSASLNMDQMLMKIVDNKDLFKSEYLDIFLIEENTKRLIHRTSDKSHRHNIEHIEALGLCLGKGITGWVAEKGEPLLVNDVKKDPRYISGDESIRSEICAPLKVGQKVIGVIDAQSRELNAFSQNDLRLLNIAAGQIATLIENNRLEEEIKKSEEKYRTVVENAIDGVCVIGGNYLFKYVNERLADIQGYRREELIGTDFRNLLDEESRALLADREDKRARGIKLPPHFELNIRHKDGGVRNAEISASAIKDSKGDVNIIVFLKDITDRKQGERALRESEETARRLSQENVTVAEIGRIISSTLNIEEVYERFAEKVRKILPFDRVSVNTMDPGLTSIAIAYTFGVKIGDSEEGIHITIESSVYEDIVNRRSSILIQTEDESELAGRYPNFVRHFRAGLRSMIATPLISQDQLIGILHIQSLKPHAYTESDVRLAERVGNQIAGAIANAQLFMKSKQAEEKYRAIIRTAMDGFWMVDMQGRFLDVNDAYCWLIGYSRDELLTMRISDVEGEERPEDTARRIQKIMEVGRDRFETHHKCKDGRIINVEISVNYMEVNGGRMFVFLRDITERKRTEESLLKSEEETRRLAQENVIVAEIGKIVSSTLDIEEVYERFAEEVRKLIPFDRIMINLIDLKNNTINTAYITGVNVPDQRPGNITPLTGTATEEVVRIRSSLLIQGDNIDEVASRFPRLLPTFQAGFRSLIFVPMISKDQVIGVLSFRSLVPKAYTDQDVRLAESISNQIAGAIANAQLFTERKQAEEALRTEKQKFQTVSENAPFGMAMIDQTGTYKYINPKFTELFGYDLNDIPDGKTWYRKAFPDPAYRHHAISFWINDNRLGSHRGGEKTIRTFTVTCKDGTEKIIEFLPVELETGEFLTSFVDITLRKKAEDALQKSEEAATRLAQENAMVAEIGRIISSTLNIEEVYERFAEEVRKFIQFERITVNNINPKENTFVVLYNAGLDMADRKVGKAVPLTGTATEWVMQNRSTLLILEENREEMLGRIPGLLPIFKVGFRSMMFIPLISKDQVIGTLALQTAKQNAYTEVDLKLAERVSAQIAGAIANAQLFNERKRMEDALRESENKFRCLVENSIVGVYLIQGGIFKYANARFVEIHGYEIEEMVGKMGATQTIFPEDLSIVAGNIDKRMRGEEESMHYEFRIVTKTQEIRYGEVFGSRTIYQGKPAVIGTMLDITDRKKAEEALRQSEEKYRNILESIEEGYYEVDLAGNQTFFNDSLCRIYGYPKEEVTGTNYRRFTDQENAKKLFQTFNRVYRTGEPGKVFDWEIIRKDGTRRHVEASVSLQKDTSGKAIGFRGILRDVTEKKKAEEQLLQTEKLRAVGEMASGVAHDFNNALAAILGNTQLLLYTTHDEELKETLKIIEKVAKDSGQTIRRLQDFTRKRVDQEIFKIDVNSVIKDSMEMTKPKWKDEPQSRGIRIEMVSNLEEIPSVSGNGAELREVITNMIFNAIEAMPEGGKIEIRTFKKRRNVFIQISDSGIGIAEEAERKIFEPFFTTKPFTNTGLGLSMSYGIIKRFGGEIEVESKVGQGTTFTIILPIGGEEKEEAVSPQPIRKGRKAHILVIDDDEFVRSVLSRTLTQANHQVTLAENGEKGVRVFKEGKFDIVLTDLGMPGISGWEVCRIIKEINPQIPVGMITGWGVDKNRTEMEEHGLDFFISKPFDFNQILNVVSETMASKEE